MHCENASASFCKKIHTNPSFFPEHVSQAHTTVRQRACNHHAPLARACLRAWISCFAAHRVPVYELESHVFQHKTRIQHMTEGAFFILSRSICLPLFLFCQRSCCIKSMLQKVQRIYLIYLKESDNVIGLFSGARTMPLQQNRAVSSRPCHLGAQ